jgi:hypothetical protein
LREPVEIDPPRRSSAATDGYVLAVGALGFDPVEGDDSPAADDVKFRRPAPLRPPSTVVLPRALGRTELILVLNRHRGKRHSTGLATVRHDSTLHALLQMRESSRLSDCSPVKVAGVPENALGR